MNASNEKPVPGDHVLLKILPPGLLDGLPARDRRAISAIVGKTVLLVEYDDAGRAELEFVDEQNHNHSIWVDPQFIESAPKPAGAS